MTTWFLFAFVAQLFWVAGALLDKILLQKYATDAEEVDSITSLVFISSVFSSVIAFGVLALNLDNVSFEYGSFYGLIAGICNGLWVYIYLQALDMTESSKAIPLFQTIPIFGMVLAAIFLGEVLDFSQIAGIFIIVVGSLILTYNFANKTVDFVPTFLMLFASGVVAIQETIFKLADIQSSYWNATFWMLLGFPVFVLILSLVEKKLFSDAKALFKKKFVTMWSFSTVNEAIDNSATLLFVFAITLAPVAIVQSVNALQPLLMLVAATTLAKLTNNYIAEDLQTINLFQKLAGVLTITSGSLLLYTNLLT